MAACSGRRSRRVRFVAMLVVESQVTCVFLFVGAVAVAMVLVLIVGVIVVVPVAVVACSRLVVGLRLLVLCFDVGTASSPKRSQDTWPFGSASSASLLHWASTRPCRRAWITLEPVRRVELIDTKLVRRFLGSIREPLKGTLLHPTSGSLKRDLVERVSQGSP